MNVFALFLSLAIALALPIGALAQITPRGGEFRVNTYTTGYQSIPSVSSDAEGDFVVVWKSPHDGSDFGVFGRRFTSAGAPLASEFQVNVYTTGYQGFSSVAVEADGDFVVAWESTQDGENKGAFARRFASTGLALATEFQVNTRTTGPQYRVWVAGDADGDFVVTWEANQDGEGKGVFAQRFSSDGARLASEFQVNSYTTQSQRLASVAASPAGDFVVAWQSYNDQDGGGMGIFAQRFASDGSRIAGEFQVNSYTPSTQRYPSVSVGASGDFIVTWYSYTQDGSGYGVFARRFASAGVALATEFQVATRTYLFQGVPAVRTIAGDDFVVAWSSTQDGSDYGVFVRRYSSSGATIGGELQVNTYTPLNQHFPTVAALGGGGFVIAWTSYGQDGSDLGIFAQRFAALGVLDIDGNGSTEPLTDGLLLLRRFFGFSGTTLTGGIVGPMCTRCDAAAIEPYIATLGLLPDIDADGENAPLTDGLLVVRYLFGFTGVSLVTGTVDLQNCTRCNAAVIEPYLANLKH